MHIYNSSALLTTPEPCRSYMHFFIIIMLQPIPTLKFQQLLYLHQTIRRMMMQRTQTKEEKQLPSIKVSVGSTFLDYNLKQIQGKISYTCMREFPGILYNKLNANLHLPKRKLKYATKLREDVNGEHQILER